MRKYVLALILFGLAVQGFAQYTSISGGNTQRWPSANGTGYFEVVSAGVGGNSAISIGGQGGFLSTGGLTQVLGSPITGNLGWLNTTGEDSLGSDVTNATTTFTNLTDLNQTDILTSRRYASRYIFRCDNSTAADGVKFDFNGGTVTTSAFWAIAHQIGGTTAVAGTLESTSLAGVINYTTITGTTYIAIDVYFTPSGGGTFIMRAAENASTTGTLTLRTGSSMDMKDVT